MRKKVQEIYDEAKVIISWCYGLEFREDPKSRGRLLYKENYKENTSDKYIEDTEIKEILAKKEGESGKSLKNFYEAENKLLCSAYCTSFDSCDRDPLTAECLKEKGRK